MTDYTIVIEEARTNFAAYVIGLDGTVTTGATIDEMLEHMRAAIAFHREGVRLSGIELIEPMPIVKTIQVAA